MRADGSVRTALALVACVAAALPASGAHVPSPDRANAIRVFTPLVPALRTSGVPVLVPARLDARSLSHVSAQVVYADRDGYSIELEFAHDCDFTNACHVGQISARRGGHRPSGARFVMGDGRVGAYVEGSCAAYCNESTVAFRRGSVTYTFAEKGAERELHGLTAEIVPIRALTAR